VEGDSSELTEEETTKEDDGEGSKFDEFIPEFVMGEYKAAVDGDFGTELNLSREKFLGVNSLSEDLDDEIWAGVK